MFSPCNALVQKRMTQMWVARIRCPKNRKAYHVALSWVNLFKLWYFAMHNKNGVLTKRHDTHIISLSTYVQVIYQYIYIYYMILDG